MSTTAKFKPDRVAHASPDSMCFAHDRANCNQAGSETTVNQRP